MPNFEPFDVKKAQTEKKTFSPNVFSPAHTSPGLSGHVAHSGGIENGDAESECTAL